VDRVPTGLVARGLTGLSWSSPMPTADQGGHRHGPVRRHVATLSNPLHGQPRFAHPKLSWPMIATLVRSIFEQADRDATWPARRRGRQAHQRRVLRRRLYVLDAADDILAFTAFPVEHWPRSALTIPGEAQ